MKILVSAHLDRLESSHGTAKPVLVQMFWSTICLHVVYVPRIWTVQKAQLLTNAPGANGPGITTLVLDAPFANHPSRMKPWRNLPYSPTQHDSCLRKKALGKNDTWKKDLEEKLSLLKTPPTGNGITHLKWFRRKPLPAASRKKSMSSIEIRASWGETVGVNIFLSFFCLYINVHLFYILTYILSIL